MAFTQSLDHSMSVGGARLQCWTITGDGSDRAFECGLLNATACWTQNIDDTDTSAAGGVSMTVSGGTITFGRLIASGKKNYVFVLGE